MPLCSSPIGLITGNQVSLQRVVEVDQGAEVGPAQLSTQRGDNLAVGEPLDEADHVAQILLREPAAVIGALPESI